MLLSIIDDGPSPLIDVTIEVPEMYAEVIRLQLERISAVEERKRFNAAIARHLARLLGDFMDHDLRPPTEKQIVFAYSLAQQHDLEIPREALITRSAMGRFLDEHAPLPKGAKDEGKQD